MAVPRNPSARFLIIGHRGSPLAGPENSIESLEAAFAAGADAIETDLRRLRDGSVVLHHDGEVGGQVVEDLTMTELRRLVPTVATLDEALRTFPDRRLILEVKRAGWEDELRSVIKDRARHLTISSFDHSVLSRFPSPIARGVLLRRHQPGAAAYARTLGAECLFPPVAAVDADLVATCHEVGISVIPWTSDNVSEWETLLSYNCDGVITNIPEAAVEWRRRALC